MKYSKPDKFELQATVALKDFFKKHKEDVFYSRQLEVMFEDKYFHWITNRVIRELLKEGFIKAEDVELFSGAWMRLIFHSSLRYYTTRLKNVVALVKEYSDPIKSEVIGLHAEHLFLEGFSKNRFTLEGRNTREFNSHEWTKSDHNLDFILKRDNICYGTEIKNSLSYIDEKELEIKIELCKFLGIIPLFIVRMAPGRYIDVVKKLVVSP